MKEFIEINEETIIDSISRAINSKDYISALYVALTIPDYCSKYLKETKTKNYINWCNKWLECYYHFNKDFYLNNYHATFGNIIYQLRCSLFHDGENNAAKNVKNNFFIVSEFKLFIDEDELNDPLYIFHKRDMLTNPEKNEYEIHVNILYLVKTLYSAMMEYRKFKDRNGKLESKAF